MRRILLIPLMIFAFLFGYKTSISRHQKIRKFNNVEKILVLKSKRELSLMSVDGKTLATYKIALGSNPKGHKYQEGDGKTPEGVYKIDYRQKSKNFYKSLHISYPNDEDKKQAKLRGVSPGGLIMIHGLGGWRSLFQKMHKKFDWTQGCIAVDNNELDEIWKNIKDGIIIEIRE